MRAFVVMADTKPVAHIVEESQRHAEAVVASLIFRGKLVLRVIDGHRAWDGLADLTVRNASPEEAADAHLGMARMRLLDPDAPEGAGATMLFGDEIDPDE